MSSVAISIVAMLICIAGLALGNVLRAWIPEEHVLREDSLKSLELSAAMMGTLVALVIGLLVSSSKNSFDVATQGITQAGASLLTLDGLLRAYGPDAAEARQTLKDALGRGVRYIRDGEMELGGRKPQIEPLLLQRLHRQIRSLEPGDPNQEDVREQAIEINGKLMQDRWLLIEQSQNELPTLFLVMLLIWLFVLFGIFGLITPRNPTTLVCQVVTACSISGALFLILELNRPLSGSMKVSLAPLTKAIELIDRLDAADPSASEAPADREVGSAP